MHRNYIDQYIVQKAKELAPKLCYDGKLCKEVLNEVLNELTNSPNTD